MIRNSDMIPLSRIDDYMFLKGSQPPHVVIKFDSRSYVFTGHYIGDDPLYMEVERLIDIAQEVGGYDKRRVD